MRRALAAFRVRTALACAAALVALAAAGAAHAIAWYFQAPASKLAADIDWLHQLVMWLIVVIFVGVFGVMFYACWAHRKSRGHKAEQFHENTAVEILWTVIPAIILVAVALPVTKVGQMTAIPLLLYHEPLFGLMDSHWVGTVLINIAAVLTVVSMLYYLRQALPYMSVSN